MIRDLVRLLLFPPKAGSPFRAYGGNHVVLKCGNAYPLMAHLPRGSLRVKVGDGVRAGDQVGQVGNSGSSLQPHLHFQVMESENPFPLFKNLLPFRLRGVRKLTGGEWKEESNADVGNGDRFQM